MNRRKFLKAAAGVGAAVVAGETALSETDRQLRDARLLRSDPSGFLPENFRKLPGKLSFKPYPFYTDTDAWFLKGID